MLKRLYFTLILLTCAGIAAYAQQKTITQEEAEMDALANYEKTHAPASFRPGIKPSADEFLYGSRIQRFMTLLSMSTKERHVPVSVLVYGQSIMGSEVFTETLKSYFAENFPYAPVKITNLAIGGFSGDRLVRTADHDLNSTCYDLVIFHVYGGEDHGELETIFSEIRRKTTADIILLNHHINSPNNTISYDVNSYNYMNFIANKYDCELVDVSKEWSQYLLENGYKTEDLLRDSTHPNRHGNWLLVQLIGKHLRLNPYGESDWFRRVKTYYLNTATDSRNYNPLRFKNKAWEVIDGIYCGKDPQNSLMLEFTGNRVDIIAGKTTSDQKLGSARILIDGAPVSKQKQLYTITRPSPGPGTWFPAVRHIDHVSPLVPETWVMKIEKVNADSTVWNFSITGSVTGYDGSGNTNEDFVSKSGRVKIRKDDYMLLTIKDAFKVVAKPGFEIHWEVKPTFIETYKAEKPSDSLQVVKTTVAYDLSNSRHTIEIVPDGNGIVPIEALEVHRPPLED